MDWWSARYYPNRAAATTVLDAVKLGTFAVIDVSGEVVRQRVADLGRQGIVAVLVVLMLAAKHP